MEPNNQTEPVVQQPMAEPVAPVTTPTPATEPMRTMPVEGEKHHSSIVWILVILVIAAIALFFIVNATNKMHSDTDQMMPENNGQMMPATDDSAQDGTMDESASMRSDLEQSNTDGVSNSL